MLCNLDRDLYLLPNYFIINGQRHRRGSSTWRRRNLDSRTCFMWRRKTPNVAAHRNPGNFYPPDSKAFMNTIQPPDSRFVIPDGQLIVLKRRDERFPYIYRLFKFRSPLMVHIFKIGFEAVYVFDKVHIVVLADIELRGSKSTKAVKGPMKIMALDKQEWRRSARAHQTRLSHQDQHPSTVTCPHLRGNGGHNFTRSLLPLALTFALRQHSKCHPKLYPQLPRDDPPIYPEPTTKAKFDAVIRKLLARRASKSRCPTAIEREKQTRIAILEADPSVTPISRFVALKLITWKWRSNDRRWEWQYSSFDRLSLGTYTYNLMVIPAIVGVGRDWGWRQCRHFCESHLAIG